MIAIVADNSRQVKSTTCTAFPAKDLEFNRPFTTTANSQNFYCKTFHIWRVLPALCPSYFLYCINCTFTFLSLMFVFMTADKTWKTYTLKPEDFTNGNNYQPWAPMITNPRQFAWALFRQACQHLRGLWQPSLSISLVFFSTVCPDKDAVTTWKTENVKMFWSIHVLTLQFRKIKKLLWSNI